MRKTLAVTATLLGAMLPAVAQTPPAPQTPSRPAAVIHRAVSADAAAQAAFDRGLLDYYAYNPEAAEHEFYTAADLDPQMAMAYWGIALSNAPNLNVPATDDRDHQARLAIRRAKALEAHASVEDRAFIDAADARFDAGTKASPKALLVAYRDALQRIAVAYPGDPDAAALYGESSLYVAVGSRSSNADPRRNDAQRTRVAALLPFFQASLEKFPKHVGLLHFYIHAAQIAGKSQIAVAAATQLAAFSLPPEDSHLTHMPGHIFFDVGMYDAGLAVAERSVAMDLADFACCHPGYYSAPRYYRYHNVSFLLYALTETGDLSRAVAVARRANYSPFLARQLVAGGDWQSVLAVPYVEGKDSALAFARGLAYAKLGDTASAQRSLSEIPNPQADSSADAAAARAMRLTLSAEIAVAKGDDAKALELLARASRAADEERTISHSEMPDLYYFSPHIALAELAARLGKTGIARAALQAELVASPRSPAALQALAQLPHA